MRKVWLITLMFGVTSVAGVRHAPAGLSRNPGAADALARAQAQLETVSAEVGALDREIRFTRGKQDLRPLWTTRIAHKKEHLKALISDVRGNTYHDLRVFIQELHNVQARLYALEKALARPVAESQPAPQATQTQSGTGAISGVVTDSVTLFPLSSVAIHVLSQTGVEVALAATNASGFYQVSGLAEGLYYVYASAGGDYIDELYDNQWCRYSCASLYYYGNTIFVSEGQTTGNVNFSLEQYATISGTVTDQTSGAPISGAYIALYNASNNFFETSTATTADGAYVLTRVLPGIYYVLAESDNHVDELYNNISCEDALCDFSLGTAITPASGASITNINFVLGPSGRISGLLTDQLSGDPLDGFVYLYDQTGSYYTYAYSSGGSYLFTDLPPGSYFAKASAYDHVEVLYDDIQCLTSCNPVTGTPIVVTGGSETSGVNFSLPRWGAISGSVTDVSNGLPIENAWIFAWSGDILAGYGFSSATGSYTVGGLPPGSYFVSVSHPEYIDELYNDFPCQSMCDPTAGTPVGVSLNSVTSGIDFALALGGGIRGTVVAADSGAPVTSAVVKIYNESGQEITTTFSTFDGSYQVLDLVAGTYYARVLDGSYLPVFMGQLYSGIPCDPSCDVTSGTPIPVTLSQNTAGINFVLDRLGIITGTVVGATSNQGLDAYVLVYDSVGMFVRADFTGPNGVYVIQGLWPGNYYVRAVSPGYLPQLYAGIDCPDPCDVTSGTPVPAALNTTTSGINFALTKLGSISGTVTELATGNPIPYTEVQIFDASGTFVANTFTDLAGNYAISGLWPGNYFAVARNLENFVDELYSNRDCETSCDVTLGTTIPVATETVTSGINFALRAPYFADVPINHWARRWIEAAYVEQITSGCGTNPLVFCPNTQISRWQGAVWLAKARSGGVVPVSGTVPGIGTYNCTTGGTSVFSDIQPTDPSCRFVHYLAAQGITSGCGGGKFCPGSLLNRWQFAVLTANAVASSPLPESGVVPGFGSYSCTPGGTSVFLDVPPEDPGCKHIHFLAAQGVTSGCGSGNFCPGSPLTRAQGAVFTSKAFGFHRYRP